MIVDLGFGGESKGAFARKRGLGARDAEDEVLKC
jgi:hypothetical protein